MNTILTQRYRSFKIGAITRLVEICRRIDRRYNLPQRPELTPAVRRALDLPAPASPPLSPDLAAWLEREPRFGQAPGSRDLFFIDGAPLPCWQETDLTPADDWLLAANYYPYYYALFEALTAPERATRMLEIGVRTGYMGVAFARAARGPALYVGVDPNVYVRNGLQLAGATFGLLRQRLPRAEFVLFEGYSWDQDIQHSLAYSGPFDLIHIDGDHTLPGKLHDLELARGLLASDGLVLVDDYEHHSIVADAIARACRLGWFSEFAYAPTKRGLAALR